VPCREICTASRASTPMVYEKIEALCFAIRRRAVVHSDHALVCALRVSGTEPLGCAPHPDEGGPSKARTTSPRGSSSLGPQTAFTR